MISGLQPLEIRPPGTWAKASIDPVHAEELSRFADWVLNLAVGKADPEDFKKFRLENGVYGIRFKDDEHMIRIKIRFGRLTPDQILSSGALIAPAIFGFDVSALQAAAIAGVGAAVNFVTVFARYRLSVLPNPGEGLPGLRT